MLVVPDAHDVLLSDSEVLLCAPGGQRVGHTLVPVEAEVFVIDLRGCRPPNYLCRRHQLKQSRIVNINKYGENNIRICTRIFRNSVTVLVDVLGGRDRPLAALQRSRYLLEIVQV